jgi:hypothetical protein
MAHGQHYSNRQGTTTLSGHLRVSHPSSITRRNKTSIISPILKARPILRLPLPFIPLPWSPTITAPAPTPSVHHTIFRPAFAIPASLSLHLHRSSFHANREIDITNGSVESNRIRPYNHGRLFAHLPGRALRRERIRKHILSRRSRRRG